MVTTNTNPLDMSTGLEVAIAVYYEVTRATTYCKYSTGFVALEGGRTPEKVEMCIRDRDTTLLVMHRC